MSYRMYMATTSEGVIELPNAGNRDEAFAVMLEKFPEWKIETLGEYDVRGDIVAWNKPATDEGWIDVTTQNSFPHSDHTIMPNLMSVIRNRKINHEAEIEPPGMEN